MNDKVLQFANYNFVNKELLTVKEVDFKHIIICSTSNKELVKKIEFKFQGAIVIPLELDRKNFGESFSELSVLFDILKTIFNKKIVGKIVFQVLFEEKDSIFLKSLDGFFSSLCLEMGSMYGYQIIMFPSNSDIQELLEILPKEALHCCQFGSEVIKYSDTKLTKRTIQQLQFISSKEQSNLKFEFKGVIVISGGAGKIGLIFADYLVNESKEVKVVLLGRTPKELLDDDSKNIMNQSEYIYYEQVDCSQFEQVHSRFKYIRQHYGDIKGVIHAAGVIRDSLFINKSYEDIEDVCSSKVTSICNIDQCTKDDELDFMLLCSSSSALGNVGQSIYAFSNSFLNCFSEWRNQKQLEQCRYGKTISVAWPFWESGGMHLTKSQLNIMYQKQGLTPLPNNLALQVVKFLLLEKEHTIYVFYGKKKIYQKAFNIQISHQNFQLNNKLEKFQDTLSSAKNYEDIAIIGISFRLPKVSNLKELWSFFQLKQHAFSVIPESRWDPYVLPESVKGKDDVLYGAFIEDIETFDAEFFNISAREARWMDPHHRLMLEEAYLCIEQAGYDPFKLSNKNMGVFIAHYNDSFHQIMASLEPTLDVYSITGRSGFTIANRISYFFNFKGVSKVIDTACSSSLVAIDDAVKALRMGDCEQALVGAVNLILSKERIYSINQLEILSKEGFCKPFDEDQVGQVLSEGVGAILLKPLSEAIKDKDDILGIIKGTSTNHIGNRSGSMMLPDVNSNKDGFKQVLSHSNLVIEDIDYFEAHGSGGAGDTIECNAFQQLFETSLSAQVKCPVGSVKSFFGFNEAVNGITQIAKSLAMMKHQLCVPTLGFEKAPEFLKIDEGPLEITTTFKDWKKRNKNSSLKNILINSYGITGTGARIILSEFSNLPVNQASFKDNYYYLLLSAQSEKKQNDLISNMYDYILDNKDKIDMNSLCYTLQVGRPSYTHRCYIKFKSEQELLKILKKYIDTLVIDEFICFSQYDENQVISDESLIKVRQAEEKKSFEECVMFWLQGHQVDWEKLYDQPYQRCSGLPSYSFEKDKYKLKDLFNHNKIKKKYKNVQPSINSNIDKRHFDVVIIGAGSSGLAALGAFVNAGYKNICVLEKNTGIGGIWETNRYPKLHIHSKSFAYRFYNFHEPKSENEHASREEVLNYFDEYCDYYDLKKYIYFNKYVDKICYVRKKNGDICEINIKHKNDDQLYQITSDFIVFSTGFGIAGKQVSPQFKHKKLFLGNIIHASKFTQEMLDDIKKNKKNICLLGAGKTGYDLALLFESEGLWDQVSWVYSKFLWGYNYEKLYSNYSKEDHKLFLEYADAFRQLGKNHKKTKQLAKKIVDLNLILNPDTKTQDIYEFKNAIYKESEVEIIKELDNRYKEKIDYLSDRSIFLKNGQEIKGIDYLICATGFQAEANLPEIVINDQDEKHLFDPYSSSLFYRGMIHPEVKNMIFFVFEGMLFQQILYGNSIAAEWLVKYYIPKIKNFDINETLLNQDIDATYKDINENSLSETIYDYKKMRAKNKFGFSSLLTLLSRQAFFKQIFSDLNVDLMLFEALQVGSLSQRAMDKINQEIYKSLNTPIPKNEIDELKTNEGNYQVIDQKKIQNELISFLIEILQTTKSKISVDKHISRLGLDSLLLTEFLEKTNHFFNLKMDSLTVLENPTIKELSEFIGKHSKITLEKEKQVPKIGFLKENQSFQENNDSTINLDHLSFKNKNEINDIAIIGIVGRFPDADTVTELWNILKNEESVIKEIPSLRWDWKSIYGDPLKEIGKTDSKYGGFINNIDQFDADFFNILPVEAKLMDPQHRHVIEIIWELLEQAGYAKTILKEETVSFYLGLSRDEYQHRSSKYDGNFYLNTGNSKSLSSGLISHLFNFNGPCLTIDSACASSSVAIYQAIESLKAGTSTVSIACGVNFLLDYMHHIDNRKVGMITNQDKVLSFDKKGEGFLFSEGVAAVLLKPLKKAEEDRDYIHGVIKSIALNHGGTSIQATAPNHLQQSNVIDQALKKAQLSKHDLDYIEGQGMATDLTDKAELAAYEKSFEGYLREKLFIGSLKGNIGHNELASGITSLVKVLFAMKHKVIPKTLYSRNLNIDKNKKSVLKLVDQKLKWPQKSNNTKKAGVFNYGFNGANAFMVVESYEKYFTQMKNQNDKDYMIPFSAKTENELIRYLKRFFKFLEKKQYQEYAIESISIQDIAYSLKKGRSSFDVRLAFVVKDINQLQQGIQEFLEGKDFNIFFAYQRMTFSDTLSNLQKEAIYWVDGEELQDVGYLNNARMIPLPTYAFADTSFWIDDKKELDQEDIKPRIHTMLHHNCSTESQILYQSMFTGKESFLNDHVINGQKILPGAAYLEMARTALCDYLDNKASVAEISNVFWKEPFTIDLSFMDCFLELKKESEFKFRSQIYSINQEKKIIHSEALLSVNDVSLKRDKINLDKIKDSLNGMCNKKQFYKLFSKLGVSFGPAHQVIEKLYYSDSIVLAHVLLPDFLKNNQELFVLHPSLMDAAFQSILGLELSSFNDKKNNLPVLLPFSIERIFIFSSLPDQLMIHTAYSKGSGPRQKVLKYDIQLCDLNGNICVFIKEFSVRRLVQNSKKQDELSKRSTQQAQSNFDNLKETAIQKESITKSSKEPSLTHQNKDLEIITKQPIKVYLVNVFVEVTGLSEDKINVEESFDSFGINSVMVTELTLRIQKDLGDVSQTLFFEYETINEIADYLFLEKLFELKNNLGIDVSIKNNELNDASKVDEHQKDDKSLAVALKDEEKKVLKKIQVSTDHFYFSDNISYLLKNKAIETIDLSNKSVLSVIKDLEKQFYLGFLCSNNVPDIKQAIKEVDDSKNQLVLLSNTNEEAILNEMSLNQLPFGITQVIDVNDFKLTGNKMRKLRYAVQKFKDNVSFQEVDIRSNEFNDIYIALVKKWIFKKENILNIVAESIKDLINQSYPDGYRIFLTFKNNEPVSVIIIRPLEHVNGYLMQDEFYDTSESFYGHMEYSVSELISILKKESFDFFSLGLTFYPFVNEEVFDEKGYSFLEKIGSKGMLKGFFDTAKKNHQFKNKFKPINQVVRIYFTPCDDYKWLFYFYDRIFFSESNSFKYILDEFSLNKIDMDNKESDRNDVQTKKDFIDKFGDYINQNISTFEKQSFLSYPSRFNNEAYFFKEGASYLSFGNFFRIGIDALRFSGIQFPKNFVFDNGLNELAITENQEICIDLIPNNDEVKLQMSSLKFNFKNQYSCFAETDQSYMANHSNKTLKKGLCFEAFYSSLKANLGLEIGSKFDILESLSEYENGLMCAYSIKDKDNSIYNPKILDLIYFLICYLIFEKTDNKVFSIKTFNFSTSIVDKNISKNGQIFIFNDSNIKSTFSSKFNIYFGKINDFSDLIIYV